MNKFLKYGLLGAGGVGVLAVGAAAYLAATFNPNDYKAQIIQAVQDRMQRTLRLDGDIKLAFLPNIGVDIGKASLSEFNSEKEFAALDAVHVSLALLPLFSRQVIVDELTISGLKVALVKFKDGKTNIDALLGKDESKSEASWVKFDIASVRLEQSELSYRDENTGAQYALKNINLKSGRIGNGVPGKIDFSAMIHADQPRLDITSHLQAVLTFDLGKHLYQVEKLDLRAKGEALDISDLAVQVSGNASMNFGAGEFSAQQLALTATGSKGGNSFDAKLDAPVLGRVGNKFSSDKLTLELGMTQRDRAYQVKLSSPVDGNLKVRQFNFPGLTVAVSASGDKLPGQPVNREMKGDAQVDAGRQSVRVNLAGGLLQSQVKAKVAVNGFAHPAIRFDVDVDQFDADLYLPKKGRATRATATEQPFDLSALRKLDLEGSLRIGTLKMSNVKSSQVRLDMKARHGV